EDSHGRGDDRSDQDLIRRGFPRVVETAGESTALGRARQLQSDTRLAEPRGGDRRFGKARATGAGKPGVDDHRASDKARPLSREEPPPRLAPDRAPESYRDRPYSSAEPQPSERGAPRGDG